MLWISLLSGLIIVGGEEIARAGRVRFPYDGPVPPMLEEAIFGSNVYHAESQNRPIYLDNKRGHHPIGPQKNGDNFYGNSELHSYTDGIILNNKPFMNQNRPTNTRTKNQFHETQPPPFGGPQFIRGPPKIKGVLNPPPPTHHSSSYEGERHRFEPHPSTFKERRPPVNRPPHPNGNGRPLHMQKVYHQEKHFNRDDRQPIIVKEGMGPNSEPNYGQESLAASNSKYPTRGRYPFQSPKPPVRKEKVKVPFNAVKKTPFSLSEINKFPSSAMTLSPAVDSGSNLDSSLQEDDYYQSKLNEEYYSTVNGNRDTPNRLQFPSSKPSNPHIQHDLPEGMFGTKDPSYGLNSPIHGEMAEYGNVPSGNVPFQTNKIPQSSFFDANAPQWSNDYKEEYPPFSNDNLKMPEGHRSPPVESASYQQYRKETAEPDYYSGDWKNNKVNKRYPEESGEKDGYFFDSEEDYGSQFGQKAEKDPFFDERPNTESFPDSSEFDFGSNSKFNMDDFNVNPFNFGSERREPGSEWIPINAPNEALGTKPHDSSIPHHLKDYFYGGSQSNGSRTKQNNPSRPVISGAQKNPMPHTSNVVYGARETRRQNEGVVSASVMVKQ